MGGLGEDARRLLVCAVIGSGYAFSAQKIGKIIDPLIEQIQLAGHPLDLGFGAAIDVEIEFATQPVFGVLTILTHHDDGGLDLPAMGFRCRSVEMSSRETSRQVDSSSAEALV